MAASSLIDRSSLKAAAQRVVEPLVCNQILRVDIGIMKDNEFTIAERPAACMVLCKQCVMEDWWIHVRHRRKLTRHCLHASACCGLREDALPRVHAFHVRVVRRCGSHNIANGNAADK
eukprot:CAMPEP_0119337718 /NCGR_PEP_ID=MMETSP1333-20130426/94579_1 /TAXON_ID=418940 /ORGANISM="Scyphosphaera apsteinii, Strain RCC1455" /LENGTH=117 /DNA_ID=CAMNT_0007348833 /DNA_START=324 /DNA_END=678 /DNA_ORIENTATION=-